MSERVKAVRSKDCVEWEGPTWAVQVWDDAPMVVADQDPDCPMTPAEARAMADALRDAANHAESIASGGSDV